MKTFYASGNWDITSFKAVPNVVEENWIIPNQTSYPIGLTIIFYDPQTEIRNVSLTLLVIDD